MLCNTTSIFLLDYRDILRNIPTSPKGPYEEGYKKGRSAGYGEGYNERKIVNH